MKVVNVDGKLNPEGLPTTAMRSRDGRGRCAICLLASPPACSIAIATTVRAAPFHPASQYANPTARGMTMNLTGSSARFVICVAQAVPGERA